MKQAIQQGFILDVLQHYTPADSYYRLVKTVPGDPEYDVKKARKKLRRYVESHDHAIRLKGEIMVDHFHEQVIGLNKIGGRARAMVVTGSIERAIQYFHAIRDYLEERKSPYRAIVAFSGEHDYGGTRVSGASLKGFPSNQIADKIREEPYRFLICADNFQTDPNKLHYLKAALDGYQVYAPEQVEQLVRLYLDGAERDKLDPILDACVARYLAELNDDTELFKQFTENESFSRWLAETVFELAYER
jgi:type I restriction enzyme R subunit